MKIICRCQCHPTKVSGFKHSYDVGDKRKKTICWHCLPLEANFQYPSEGDFIKVSRTKWHKLVNNIKTSISLYMNKNELHNKIHKEGFEAGYKKGFKEGSQKPYNKGVNAEKLLKLINEMGKLLK